jgi:hypothetical protein
MKILVLGWSILWSVFFVLSVYANIAAGMPLFCAGIYLFMALPGWIILYATSNHGTNGAQLPYQVYDSPELPPPGKASPNSTRLYAPPPLD